MNYRLKFLFLKFTYLGLATLKFFLYNAEICFSEGYNQKEMVFEMMGSGNHLNTGLSKVNELRVKNNRENENKKLHMYHRNETELKFIRN